MGIGLVKNESSLALKLEVTEGTYVAPTGASDFIEVVADGVEFSLSRDLIERNNLTSTIETVAPRVGQKNVAGSVAVEATASSTEGNPPPADLLLRSLMGGRRQLSAPVTSKAAGHTSTTIEIEDADIASFVKNGVYLFKLASGYEVRPVTVIDSTPGAAKITVPFAFEGGAPVVAVVIAKMTQYYFLEGAPTLSATYYNGGEIEDQVSGIRCVSASLDNWSTAQTAQWTFAAEGLNLERSVAAPAFSPNFSSNALPPVLLGACVYFNGIELQYNELALSIENTKTDIASACSPEGKVGSRFTNFKVSGSFNPYMENDDVARFDNFNLNDTCTIFGFAKNPGAVAGQDKEWVCFWIPNAKITEIPTADVDGILTDAISFQAFRNEGNDSVFVSFI